MYFSTRLLFSLSKYQGHGLTGVISRNTVYLNHSYLENKILLLIIYLIIILTFFL